jgi:predicted HAD superfamily Cof-like phosphohydrolase
MTDTPRYRTSHELVREFYDIFHPKEHVPPADTKASLRPDVIPPERLHLKMELIAEEFRELVAAVYGSTASNVLEAAWCIAKNLDDGTRDVVAAADATADLRYVIEGFDIESGIPSQKILQEVHASNLSKLDENGKPIVSDGTTKPLGKILKGPNFFEPNIEGVLNGDAPRGLP